VKNKGGGISARIEVIAEEHNQKYDEAIKMTAMEAINDR